MAKEPIYDFKVTLKKGIIYFVLFLLPVLVDKFLVSYPEIAQLTIGGLLVMGTNFLKHKVGVRFLQELILKNLVKILIGISIILALILSTREAEGEKRRIEDSYQTSDTFVTQISSPYIKPCEGIVDVEELIYCFSDYYSLSRSKSLRVATCESGLDPYIKNRSGSSASGLYQFIARTWSTTIARMRTDGIWISNDVSVFDPYWNAYAAHWLASHDGWRHWVCK